MNYLLFTYFMYVCIAADMHIAMEDHVILIQTFLDSIGDTHHFLLLAIMILSNMPSQAHSPFLPVRLRKQE
ncbi:MAG: hypothetical protein ACOCWQ_03225 [Nanoarchaeota archaeon]